MPDAIEKNRWYSDSDLDELISNLGLDSDEFNDLFNDPPQDKPSLLAMVNDFLKGSPLSVTDAQIHFDGTYSWKLIRA